MDAKKTAEELDQAGKCIICRLAKPNRSRGLCQKHYHQFRREKMAIPAEHQDEYEKELIELGMILETKKPWESSAKSVFERVSEKYKQGTVPGSAAQEGIDRYERSKDRIRKRVAQTKAKKAAKKKPDTDKGTAQ